jgi:hypothetical protein
MWPNCLWRSKYTAVSCSARRQYRHALSDVCIELGDEVVAPAALGVLSGWTAVGWLTPVLAVLKTAIWALAAVFRRYDWNPSKTLKGYAIFTSPFEYYTT